MTIAEQPDAIKGYTVAVVLFLVGGANLKRIYSKEVLEPEISYTRGHASTWKYQLACIQLSMSDQI